MSRTFGDIEAKVKKLHGKAGVVIATPHIKEFEITSDMDFMFLGCDGIFDNLNNGDVIAEIWTEIENNHSNFKSLHALTGDCVDRVMKSAIASRTLDNITSLIFSFKSLNQAFLLRED